MRLLLIGLVLSATLATPFANGAPKPKPHPRPKVATKPASKSTPKPKPQPVSPLPNDPGVVQEPWPFLTVGLPAAWKITQGSPQIVIAVVDTGVSAVPDLASVLVGGTNLIDPTADTHDDNSHGTVVASVIAARHGDRTGTAGVCPACRIMPVKVIGQSGFGTSDLLAQGIRWAADHGARVINCSITATADTPDVDQAIVDATAEGAVVVLAAGNGGSSDPAAGGYPAAMSPDAIRVAGVDQTGALYGWSNRGTWVDVAAPGSASGDAAGGRLLVGEIGTSVAAPFVSGLAGLVLSRNPALTPAQVKQIIVSTAAPRAAGSPPEISAATALSEALTPPTVLTGIVPRPRNADPCRSGGRHCTRRVSVTPIVHARR